MKESTPGARRGCPLFAPSAREQPAPGLVPSSWFSTTSTASSSNTARTSCSPLPTVGFTSFPGTVPSSSPRCVPPFEAFPPDAATSRFRDPWGAVTRAAVADDPVHPIPCPLVVPGSHPPTPSRVRRTPCRHDREVAFPSASTGRATSGPCSTPGSVVDRTVARPPDPLLPGAWAFPRPPGRTAACAEDRGRTLNAGTSKTGGAGRSHHRTATFRCRTTGLSGCRCPIEQGACQPPGHGRTPLFSRCGGI